MVCSYSFRVNLRSGSPDAARTFENSCRLSCGCHWPPTFVEVESCFDQDMHTLRVGLSFQLACISTPSHFDDITPGLHRNYLIQNSGQTTAVRLGSDFRQIRILLATLDRLSAHTAGTRSNIACSTHLHAVPILKMCGIAASPLCLHGVALN
jgi:hypothetical protein